MTTFDERERAFESAYAHDQELQFKVAARRNRLVAGWAAERMGLSPTEADGYARDVIHADFEEGGDEAVMRKITGDLTGAGVDVSDAELRDVIAAKSVEARRHYMGEV